jgi:hypothetical protein
MPFYWHRGEGRSIDEMLAATMSLAKIAGRAYPGAGVK